VSGPAEGRGVGDVVVGTCSWTDKTMIERWYPAGVSTPEARLRYYSNRFDTVEIDSTFYGLPRPEYAVNWAKRTPDGFTFHVKAYGLMTGHEVDERSLAPELRDFGYDITPRGRVRNPDERMVERSFDLFVDRLQPLAEAGKLGGILMQYPPYFTAEHREQTHANLERIERDSALLDPLPVFVEFRHASWVTGAQQARTMRFLSDHGLTYVSVDAPGVAGPSVMPPVTAVTAPQAYVRFHGRNASTWYKSTALAADRFDYLYTPEELETWRDPIRDLAENTERTWVMFNNCRYDYAPRNAAEMAGILGDVVAPRAGAMPTGEPFGDEGASDGNVALQTGEREREKRAPQSETLF
jgi:uncharacterized protein YecE (DUF72 family)